MSPRARDALRGAVLATRPRWRRLALSVLLGTAAVLAAVGLLTTSGYLVSRAAQQPEILALSVAIVGVRFFGIARALLRYLERLVSHDLAFRTLTDLRRRFFARLVPLVPGGLAGSARSELLSRFVGDVDRLQDLYLRALAPPLVAALAGAGAVLVAFLMLPAAAVALAAMLLMAGVLAPMLTRLSARSAGRRQAAARSALGTDMIEVASGSAEIAVAGREQEWLSRIEADGARLAHAAAARRPHGRSLGRAGNDAGRRRRGRGRRGRHPGGPQRRPLRGDSWRPSSCWRSPPSRRWRR